MRSLLVLVALGLALGGCEGTGSSEYVAVAAVGDGDTVELEGGQRVRLLQIDAPELGEGECYASELLDAVDEARAGHRGMWAACQVDWAASRQVDAR